MCSTMIKEWAESEYIEKPVISKKDKAFLDCLVEDFKYMARDKNNALYAYGKEPYKSNNGDCWGGNNGRYCALSCYVNVAFPMIKWEDDKPWLIDDTVCETVFWYMNNMTKKTGERDFIE